MAKYAKHIMKIETPQTQKAAPNQVKGKAGGYVFQVDNWTKLNRFLIMGNEKGSYYAAEREMTLVNYDGILACLKKDPKRTVDTIVQISDEGRAVKNEPAVFALAVCSVHGDEATKAYANKVMPKVARYSTDFFSWVNAVITLKEGRKGKGLLRAMGRWYTEKNAPTLAYQVCKYPSRSIGGQKWTHADILRLCRISPAKKGKKVSRNGRSLTIPSADHSIIFNYAVHGVSSNEDIAKRISDSKKTEQKQKKLGMPESTFDTLKDGSLKYIWGHEKCSKATSIKEVVSLVKDYQLTRESVPPHFRNELEVQKVLLPHMPMTALIRNLGAMTSSGLLKSLGNETGEVISKLTNEEYLSKARIHPMAIMLAMKTYVAGKGMRTSWSPISSIKDALEDAFYKSFKYVEPTGKKFLFGIDVSGSMGSSSWSHVSDNEIMSPREAAAVVAMTCARTEKNYAMMAFSRGFVPLNITAKDSLPTVMQRTANLPFDGTDCSLPMTYAMKEGLDVDVFVVLTDNETWFGKIHPFEALKQYRAKFNKNAKLAVLAFTANEFSIADPKDSGMIDIAGLDANVPKILSEFAAGRL